MRLKIISLLIIVGLGAAVSTRAFFSEPTDMAPKGTTSGPILSGNVDQTRYGPLGLGGVYIPVTGEYINRGNLMTPGDLSITNDELDSELCLYGSAGYRCITDWTDAYRQFVRLSPPNPEVDLGTIHLNGRATFIGAAGADFGLYTRAATPGPVDRTHGFKGLAASQSVSDKDSYGVLGIAGHNSNITGRQAYGILGYDSGNSNAYAGYFDGNVELVGAQLCFFNSGGDNEGTCINDWPVAGPADDLLKLQTEFPLVHQSGITAVSGAARFTSAVVGDPSGHGQETTCGDGICSAGAVPAETAASCPIDCPTISNVTGEWLDPATARFTWTSNTAMSSIVQYGASAQYASIFRDDAYTTSHSIIVADLTNEQSYHFRVGGLTSGSGVALFSADYVLSGIGDDIAPLMPALAPAPWNVPRIHLPTTGDPSTYVLLTWAHTMEDLPPPPDGSGFSKFIIYRRIQGIGLPVYLGENSISPEYRDETVEAGKIYEYSVSALDRNNNESGVLVYSNVHVPARCDDDTDCGVDPGYPYCCTGYDGYACTNQTCDDPGGGGSSPIMNKPPTSSPIMQKGTL